MERKELCGTYLWGGGSGGPKGRSEAKGGGNLKREEVEGIPDAKAFYRNWKPREGGGKGSCLPTQTQRTPTNSQKVSQRTHRALPFAKKKRKNSGIVGTSYLREGKKNFPEKRCR